MPEIDIKYWDQEIKEIDLDNEKGIEHKIEPEVVKKIGIEKEPKIVVEEQPKSEEIEPIWLALGLVIFLLLFIFPFILLWMLWN